MENSIVQSSAYLFRLAGLTTTSAHTKSMGYSRVACLLLLVIALTCITSHARADLVFTFVEDLSGVTVTGSGSLQTLSGLTFVATTGVSSPPNGAYENSLFSGTRVLGSSSPNTDLYNTTLVTFTPLSSISNVPFESISSNVTVGYLNLPTDQVYLPPDYHAGDPFAYTATKAGATLANFGLTSGQSWGARWNTGAGGSLPATEGIQFSASAAAVPEPSSFALAGMAAFVAGLIRRRKRKSAKSQQR